MERAGTPFLLTFPKVIPEQPYLGHVYELVSLQLILKHNVHLKIGQEEAFPQLLNCSLQLLRDKQVMGVWPLEFQMRLLPGTEGKTWTGEATVSQDLTNPIEYRSGNTLTFAVSGIVPGNIGGPQLTKQEEQELERIAREVTMLERVTESLTVLEENLTVGTESLGSLEESLNVQAEVVNAILELQADTGEIGNETLTLLEEILNRLFEME